MSTIEVAIRMLLPEYKKERRNNYKRIKLTLKRIKRKKYFPPGRPLSEFIIYWKI